MSDILREELDLYKVQRKDLLEKSEGKYALIHDNEVLGIFDSEHDAIRHGYKQLGNVPFLVRRIVRVEVPLHFTSFMIGV